MKEGKCPHCGKESCYAHCYADNQGKHRVIRSRGDHAYPATYITDGDSMIVDFECLQCGQSGSARVLESDVQWGDE